MCSKQIVTRKRIYEFYLANRNLGKLYTVNHFLAERVSKRAIYYIIERAENDSGHKRVSGSGRIAKIMTKKNVGRLKKMFDHRDKTSQRQAARKFGCTHQHISKTLSKKLTFICA